MAPCPRKRVSPGTPHTHYPAYPNNPRPLILVPASSPANPVRSNLRVKLSVEMKAESLMIWPRNGRDRGVSREENVEDGMGWDGSWDTSVRARTGVGEERVFPISISDWMQAETEMGVGN